ncbi:MAG: pilus assembly protein PilP [Thermodesulfovibrionales bacterium]|nr:pilus assembly protein PilP [Thermodesulfovibrionales bacterium]
MKVIFSFFIISTFLFVSICNADVTEEQQKLKGAIEKAKKPVETFKDLAPSASFLKPEGKAGNQAQQQGQQQGSQGVQSKSDVVEYIYLGKRDPFMPLIKQEAEKKKGGPSPLENFMVSDIKVVGILERNAVYYAQIVLPDGKSYTIKQGQKLGLMGGHVSKITKDTVVIKERAIDAEGKPIVKDINLKLRKEDEE